MLKKILIALLIVFVLMQAIRPARNIGSIASSTDITHYITVPDSIMKVLQRSCYDCHSNHTNYPWYTNINPVGWWMNGHIKDGKRAINFSDLSAFNKKKLDHRLSDIAKEVEEHDMPLSSYTFIHTDAKLTGPEIIMIKRWTEVASAELMSSNKF